MLYTHRIAALLLSVLLLTGCVSGCAKNGTEEPQVSATDAVSATDVIVLEDKIQQLDYEEQSAVLYEQMFGEFADYFEEADAEADYSMRVAKMAIAEAKLMEAAVIFPINNEYGGNRIDHLVPHTYDRRFQYALITKELLSSDDVNKIYKIYDEKKGTGEYEQAVRDFLQQQGYKLKNTCNIAPHYSSIDISSWDYYASEWFSSESPKPNVFVGLYEYDIEDRLQPALAESFTTSSDGLTYTFTLKSGLNWVNSGGRKVGEIVADDFVAGFQHRFDYCEDIGDSVFSILIDGAEQYISDKSKSFDSVGVKAIDDYTLEITLSQPSPFFETILDEIVPLCREYYEEQGGKFGKDFDSEAEDYLYGKDYKHTAYCGAFYVSNYNPEKSANLKANKEYCNAQNVTIKTLNFVYEHTYMDAVNGKVEYCSFSTTKSSLANKDNEIVPYIITPPMGYRSNTAILNINRAAYSNAKNSSEMRSNITDDEKIRTNLAMRNVHFRRALLFSMDREKYFEVYNNNALVYSPIVNSMTSGIIAKLDKDITIEINGSKESFPAGTYYGEIMQAQIDADGVKMKVWDKKGNNGIGSSVGFDGWYNTANAMEELEIAIEELKAQGVIIDSGNPIQIDIPCVSNTTENNYSYGQKCIDVLKKSIEKGLDGMVEVNLITAPDYETFSGVRNDVDNGFEVNYNIIFGGSRISNGHKDSSDILRDFYIYSEDYNGDDFRGWGIY